MAARNTSLDALRAIAIITVVNCHAASTFGGGQYGWLQLGGHGVDLFFGLSGWLIGKHLMLEIQKTGSVDLQRFWLRRWLRTLPAYYAVLLFTFAWSYYSHGKLPDWRFLIFWQNYADMPYFGISWSLCVEEHFYLLVAPLSWLVVRRRWAIALVPLVFLIPLVSRNMGWSRTTSETHVVFDMCASGVTLAAISVFFPQTWRVLCKLAPWLALASVTAITVAALGRVYPEWGIPEYGRSWWLLLCAPFLVLANASSFWENRTGNVVVRFIAERAYSLYLLHIEAIVIVKRFDGQHFWLTLVLVWCVSFVLAECLYRGVEKPGMQMREWFRRSQGSTPTLVAPHKTETVPPPVFNPAVPA